MIDITCVVNLHGEGSLAHRTLSSVQRAISHSQEAGVEAQLLIVCDRPTEPTLLMLKHFWQATDTLVVDHGDLGLARNAGVEAASGRYVAFVDGDDLISQNWLTLAVRFGDANANSVLHPEINVVFDEANRIFRHPNQTEGHFNNGAIGLDNFWSALCCARRSLFLEIPYTAHPMQSGFGFEDWFFNCQAISAGYRHRAVPKTAHFIRAKNEGSLSRTASANGAILRHNSLFDNTKFFRLEPQIAKLSK